MNQRLSTWTGIAEIVGTAAVVISLAFVIRSIDQNTKAIEAAEANNIWQAWREAALLPVINNSDFAAINAKVLNSEALSDVEQLQWDRYLGGQIDIWAQLFDLRSNDLISEDIWSYWDLGFVRSWDPSHERVWERSREIYDPEFQVYVDSQVR